MDIPFRYILISVVSSFSSESESIVVYSWTNVDWLFKENKFIELDLKTIDIDVHRTLNPIPLLLSSIRIVRE